MNEPIREIAGTAAAGFGPVVAEEAIAAALSVRQGDDPDAYARKVGEAVRRVLRAALKAEEADLRNRVTRADLAEAFARLRRPQIERWH